MSSNSYHNELSFQGKKSPYSLYETPKKQENATENKREPVKILKTFILDSYPNSCSDKKNNRQKTPTPSKRQSSKKSFTTPQKSIPKSKSSKLKPTQTPYTSIPNFDFELKKLLRALYRHCIACPNLKSELSSINATTLLDLYAHNRLISPSN